LDEGHKLIDVNCSVLILICFCENCVNFCLGHRFVASLYNQVPKSVFRDKLIFVEYV